MCIRDSKRATLWMNELLMDLEEVEHRISTLKLLGSKGTTGTQASFLELFEGDHEKVKELERRIAEELGFDAVVPVSGQTYSRKMDYNVLSTLAGIAQSASKFATDLRLLCHLKAVSYTHLDVYKRQVYLQGGLTFESGKLGVLLAAEELLRA